MRAAEARKTLANQIAAHFASDVAEAFTADQTMYEQCARKLGHNVVGADEMQAVIKAIAEGVDDGLADWLAENAESPAGWLYAQIVQQLDGNGS